MLAARDVEGERTALWDLSGGRPRQAHVFAPAYGPLGIGPDGRLLVLQERAGGPLVLWGVRDVGRPRWLGEVPVGTKGRITPVFGDRNVLAVSLVEGGTQLCDVSDPERPRRGQLVRGAQTGVRPGEDGEPPLLLARPTTGENADGRLAVYELSDDATARKLRDGISVSRHRAVATYVAMLTPRLLVALSDTGRSDVWDLYGKGRQAALPGSLSDMDGITGIEDPGVLTAWQEDSGARDLAVWRVTTPPQGTGDGADAGDVELVHHVTGLTEGIGDFAARLFGPGATTPSSAPGQAS